MNDVGFYAQGRGFVRCVFEPIPPGLPVGFRKPRQGEAWSAAAVELYEARRSTACDCICGLISIGRTSLALDAGVAVPVFAGDPRPSFSMLEDAALDLLTAQIAWLAHEAR